MSRKKKVGRQELERIINVCKSVDNENLDPFVLDLEELLSRVREHYPNWKNLDMLCLDAEALNQIASIVKLQGDWVKNRSSILYTDPFFIQEKLQVISKEAINEVFLAAWRPIVELEQITIRSLEGATKYWDELLPLAERWQNKDFTELETGSISRSELVDQKILAGEAFSTALENLWQKLKDKTGDKTKIKYWSFINADTYKETAERAYLTSFLVTYGYATLEVHPLEEELFIKPLKQPNSTGYETEQPTSFPISVSFMEWKKWQEQQVE